MNGAGARHLSLTEACQALDAACSWQLPGREQSPATIRKHLVFSAADRFCLFVGLSLGHIWCSVEIRHGAVQAQPPTVDLN